MKILLFSLIVLQAAHAKNVRDLEEPIPYPQDVLVSSSCISKIEALYNVMNDMFLNIPATSTLVRNDALVPFIQSTSVFTPLSSGKKTVKYQVTGVFIRNPTRTFKIELEIEDKIRFSGDWESGSSTAEISGYLSSDCSGTIERASLRFGNSASEWSLVDSWSFPSALTTFCSDKTVLMATKIDATSESEERKTAAKNMLKSNVNISALCELWGE